MGLSTYQPGRRLLDWPEDVRQLDRIARNRALRRHGLVRWGTLRCRLCGRLGDRVTAAALLSSSVPLDAYGTTRGLTPEDRAFLFLSRHTPWLASAIMKVSIINTSNTRLLRAVMRSFPPVDRNVICRVGATRVGAVLRTRIDAPGHRRLRAGLPDLRRPVGLRPRGNPSSCPHLGGCGRPPPDLPGIASSCTPTSQGRLSRSCRARDTSPSSLIRLPRSSTRCWAATRALTPPRGGTWGRRRSWSAAFRAECAACTANVSMPSTSPPVGPMEVAPTSTPLLATSLMNPSPPWIQPRAEFGVGSAMTVISPPSSAQPATRSNRLIRSRGR